MIFQVPTNKAKKQWQLESNFIDSPWWKPVNLLVASLQQVLWTRHKESFFILLMGRKNPAPLDTHAILVGGFNPFEKY